MAGPNDQPGEIELVSTASDGTLANDDTNVVDFSLDGTNVILSSYATNLLAGQTLTPGSQRFYVKNLETGKISLISSGNDPANSTQALGFTPDGNSIIFFATHQASTAPDNYSNTGDLLQQNITTGIVTLLATAVTGTLSHGSSYNLQLSPDGKRIAFASSASTLVAGDTNDAIDIFIKDLNTGIIARVSTGSHNTELNNSSLSFVLNWKTNQLLFVSDATNAVSDDTNGKPDLFVKDLATGIVTRVSDATDGTQANGGVSGFSVSADGTKVAFWSNASNLVSDDTNDTYDLFVKDLKTGVITRITTSSDGAQTDSGAFSNQFAPVFSPDGNQLMFISGSEGLVAGDTNGGTDIFIKDFITGDLNRVSTASDGSQGIFQNADYESAYAGSFSADGGEVGFSTDATGLVAGSTPATDAEAYVKVLHPAPTTAGDNYNAVDSEPLIVDAAHGVLANDTKTDSKGGALTVTSFSDALHGHVDLNPDGSFTYTPDGTFVGVDTFTYEASSGYQASADTTVSITVHQDIELVSSSTDGTSENAASANPAISPNGSEVAFASVSANLVSGDTNGGRDIFIKDLSTGITQRISTTPTGLQAYYPGGNTSGSFAPAFSPNGEELAFSTTANDLVPNDTNFGNVDIVIKDLNSPNSIQLVSAASDGTQAKGDSYDPVFSPNGTDIAFYSSASNLVAGDTNNYYDVFVKDLQSHDVQLLSTGLGGMPADGNSYHPTFSPDGAKIAFESSATNLVPGDLNGANDIFVETLTTKTIQLISTAADGTQADNTSVDPVFSPDGTKVAFVSYADNLVPGDTNGFVDVFIKDLNTGAVQLVSTAADGTQGNANSDYNSKPVFSPDGTKIAFASTASNLVPGDTNGIEDIFVKDLTTGAIERVSTAAGGAQAEGTEGFTQSYEPVFSSDGHELVFASGALNLVPGTDPSSGTRIFVKYLLEPALCFCLGTLIATNKGERPVETLKIGDQVTTLIGEHRRIRWIGRRSYAGAFIAGQHLMLPVCFKKNALADGIPHTDLFVSPGHGMFVDGQLVPAWRLINGVSVIQADAVDTVEYFHIDTGQHDILVANGAAAESFLDAHGRGQFHNAAEFERLYPRHAAMIPLQPRLEDGFALQAVQERIAARAGVFAPVEPAGVLRGFVDVAAGDHVCGWAQDAGSPEEPVALEVSVGGVPVLCLLANAYRADLRHAGLGSGCHAFDVMLAGGWSGPIEVRRFTDGSALGRPDAAAALIRAA